MTLITCSPGPSYFNPINLPDHNIFYISDIQRSMEQHAALTRLIEQSGVEVINLLELPGHPNSVFTKDTAICTPQGYIRVRMGLPSRMGEEQWIAEALEKLGVHCIGMIEDPGTAEGGDVILAGTVAFIGQSNRTNPSGIEQHT
jgi:dimethylargininase